jgi:Domain of unknown function (DUF927)
MNNLEFLQQVLGDEGYYCIVGLKNDAEKPPIQKFFQKLEDAVTVAENLKDEGYEAYYALATFKDGKSRKTANVKQLRSLFIDLDCGPGKPYATQQEALVALKDFCATTNMPKPTLVNSGGGIHAYWALTEAVSRETWLPLAEKLKKLCELHDLEADPVVTADSVRILRVPGTFNFKNDEPREVKLLGLIQDPLDLSTVEDVVGDMVLQRPSYIPRGELDDVTKAILGNYTNRFKTIMMKTAKGDGCPQLAWIYENQATMGEPPWRAGLSIAKFCIDADIAIKKISEKHPEYSPEFADRKVRGIKGGPYTCVKFEEYNPGGCDGCSHKGVIKSPIVLGREVQEATDEDNIVEGVPADVDQGHTQTYIIPKYPEPYFRGKNGGIFKRIVKEDDEIEVQIYHNDLYATRRLEDSDVGEAVVLKLHLPKDGVKEFTVPSSAVTSKEELRKYLSSKGVAMVKMDEMMSYVTTWVNHMQFNAPADTARRQFGWTDDKCEAFVLGDKEIRADRVDHNPPSAATAHLFSAFGKKGSLDGWKGAMEFYNKPGMELHQFVIGLSFGSIFTKFTSVNGALLHIFSPDSGIGKTTALYAGASIWGDPTKLVLKESDTVASKMNRAEVYNNLFLPMDEVTNSTARDLSDFLYQYTSGSQRNRMSTGSNAERTRGEPWKQTAVSTGNSSIMEKISTYKALPKGEAMRLLEVRAKPVLGLDKADTDILSETILNNYGHANLPYLQYIMQDIAGTKALYKSTQMKLDKECGFTPADRFHSVLAADGIAGLIMAKRAGLINYDIGPVVKWLINAVAAIKDQIKSMDVDAETTLTNYLAENYNNVLRIKSTQDVRATNGKGDLDHLVIPDATPRISLLARYEYDIKMLYVYPAPLKTWCTKQQINYEGFIDSLKRGRTKAKMDKKRMSKGTHMNLPSASVLWIHCEGFMDDDKEEQIAAAAAHKAALEGDERGPSLS